MRRKYRLQVACVAALCLCGAVVNGARGQANTPAAALSAGRGPATELAHVAQQAGADGVSNPLGGGGAVDLEAVPAPAAPRVSSRRIYACVGGGGPVTFSDRPCGPSASVRDLPVGTASNDPAPNGARTRPLRDGSAAAASGRATRDRSPSARGDDANGEPRDRRAANLAEATEARRRTAHDERCENLREAVAALDQHMRAGYSAREAGRLWTRWREAKERLRKSNC